VLSSSIPDKNDPQMNNSRTSHALMSFPAPWLWWVDEAVPHYVKQRYSPEQRWKNKPFGPLDVQFFSRGIIELSELFTEERPRHLPAYFQHARFRSAYLLYFLPLQAAKFLTLFSTNPAPLHAALRHGKDNGSVRIIDLGSGPGTGSLAVLMWLLGQKNLDIPPIHFEWFDTNSQIMADGQALLETLCTHFPKLRSRVSVRTHVMPWWKAPSVVHDKTSLILMGHLMNESSQTPKEAVMEEHRVADLALRPIARLFEKMDGGGALMLEPAARNSSQQLSKLRDRVFLKKILNTEPSAIWGPCLHAQSCPLASGRDWCHFSVPVRIPGHWFKEFSKALGSERQWVKFSYVWFAGKDFHSKSSKSSDRRVISDPMKNSNTHHSTVLLCEPGQPGRFSAPGASSLHRGDIITLPTHPLVSPSGSGRPPFGGQRRVKVGRSMKKR
jgi:hypothetical protein